MKTKIILSIAAHGDDAEFMAGGTLAKLADEGHDLYHLITTDNDRGSYRLPEDELQAIAKIEAEGSAKALGEGVLARIKCTCHRSGARHSDG